ncbi:uncharacterized protein MYCGRDRAFT_30507, partial [Zymoseptoria tritici IPO323]
PSRYLKDFDELGILGKGGYGQVFHVRHRLDGRTYAVKKAVLDEILTEVRSLSRLDHPNVVRYFSSWIECDAGLISSSEPSLAIHLQMDIYPMTLADFLSPPQTSSVEPLAHCFHISPSLRILLAILDGVEYLHSEGIVHRDLKPANIFLRLESNSKAASSCVDLVRIGDFGLVTSIAQSGDLTSDPPPTHAVGTELYRPAASKSSVSPKLDIFALGIIACELLTHFSTQMERRETLHSLRKGQFPDGFAGCAGHQSSKVKECVAAMLSDESPEATTI